MKTIAQLRLEQAANQGTIVVGPDTSHLLHHAPGNVALELGPGSGIEDTLVGKAAAKLFELLRPLTAREKLDAGIVPHTGGDTYHIPSSPMTDKSTKK